MTDTAGLTEAMTLEMQMGLTLFCQVPHSKCWGPAAPDCGIVAVALLVQSCAGERGVNALACQPIASWFEDVVECGVCGKTDCFRVEWL